MGEQWHMCIWILFKFKFGVISQMTLQHTCLYGFIHTSETIPHLYNITSCSTISNEHSWIQMHLKFIDKSMEFEFAFQMQYTPFKWNAQNISTMNITLYN